MVQPLNAEWVAQHLNAVTGQIVVLTAFADRLTRRLDDVARFKQWLQDLNATWWFRSEEQWKDFADQDMGRYLDRSLVIASELKFYVKINVMLARMPSVEESPVISALRELLLCAPLRVKQIIILARTSKTALNDDSISQQQRVLQSLVKAHHLPVELSTLKGVSAFQRAHEDDLRARLGDKPTLILTNSMYQLARSEDTVFMPRTKPRCCCVPLGLKDREVP